MNTALDVNVFKQYFYQFYDKVLYYKKISSAKKDLSQEEVDNISTSLTGFLQEQEKTIASDTNKFVYNIYKQLQYIMIGFADEIFLDLQWSFKDYWSEHLLESKMFNSHIAGEKIFKDIDDILKNKDNQNLLLPIYIIILSLGFVGKFRTKTNNSKEPQQLTEYKHKLFELLYKHHDHSGILFPQTRAHNMSSKNILPTNTVMIWSGILLGTFVCYCAVSYLVWYTQTREIYNIVQNIINMKMSV